MFSLSLLGGVAAVFFIYTALLLKAKEIFILSFVLIWNTFVLTNPIVLQQCT